MKRQRIALISATPRAIGPASAAIAKAFPNGVVWNLLDDRLLADAESADTTDAAGARMDGLIQLAVDGGADAVLLTCSQYGSRAAARDITTDGVAVLSAARRSTQVA
jgi:hypothetical protein